MAVERMAAIGQVDIEHLSSLIDGELDPQQAAAVIEALCKDSELQRRWADLQLVGDALRSTDVAACHVEGFCVRVSRALANEPTVLAPRPRPHFRRYLVPGAAIAASVAAIAFVAVPLLRTPTVELAAQRGGTATAAVPVVAISEGGETAQAAGPKAAAAIANARALDPYFAAHRELTGGTPLPRATAYLRTSAGEH